MKRGIMIMLFVCTVFIFPYSAFAAGAADGVEGPKSCKQCGMDRTVFDRSRMLIVYADGTSVGVCSLHCAAAEMKQNRDKQVKSLMVADYTTKELIDARTATWVVGGKKEGVMTSLPKWAFAREEDAQKFVKENGGEVTPFDKVMKAAEAEVSEDATDDPRAAYTCGPRYGPRRPNAVQSRLRRRHIPYPSGRHVDGQLQVHAYGHERAS